MNKKKDTYEIHTHLSSMHDMNMRYAHIDHQYMIWIWDTHTFIINAWYEYEIHTHWSSMHDMNMRYTHISSIHLIDMRYIHIDHYYCLIWIWDIDHCLIWIWDIEILMITIAWRSLLDVDKSYILLLRSLSIQTPSAVFLKICS